MDAFGKDWFDIREGEASVFKPCLRAVRRTLAASKQALSRKIFVVASETPL